MHRREANTPEKPADATSTTREQSPLVETKFRRTSASGKKHSSVKLPEEEE
jgi:hypothetical protein